MIDASGTRIDDRRGGLASASFVALLVTQFLGALNDNMFRWLVILVGSSKIGEATATSLGVACFTLPYLMFATHAGWLADRFDKRRVIVGCKLAEIVLMGIAVAGIFVGNVWFLLAVVFLMGSQSALFGPSKFGSIPELVRPEKISSANGVMALVTVVASATGTYFGFVLYTPGLDRNPALADVAQSAAALVGTAVVGWGASLLIRRLVAADPARRFPTNPLVETWVNLRFLGRNVPLLRASLGIAFFWFLASLANQNINVFGESDLALEKSEIGVLLVVLVAGLGLGSVLAGLWSGGRVELGIVPLGAFGIVLSSVLLYVAGSSVEPGVEKSAQQAFWWSGVWLFSLGVSAGLFNIPLEAFLQHRSETETRGLVLAAANFIAFALMLVSAGLFYLMQEPLGFSASEIFLVTGLGTIPVLIYIVRLLPGATIRFLVWLASHTVYRVRVRGLENLPERGGALLVANHVSWIDGVMLLLASSRPIRLLAETAGFKSRIVKWLARVYRVIPVHSTDGPKAILKSLQTAKEAILAGDLVCIFAEGRLTRTGQLQPFQRGMLRIIDGTGAPVVPVYLDQLWGSIFSHHGGKLFWKKPRRWPYPVTITFGPPLSEPDNVIQVRQAVQNLGVESVTTRRHRDLVPPRRLLRRCRRAGRSLKVTDSSGQQLSGSGLLMRTLAVRRALLRDILADDERTVGVLLPPSAGGVVANAALAVSRRVAVNLNYTLDEETINYCIERCGIRHVLSSRRFLEKKPLELKTEVVFLEDVAERITRFDKLVAWTQAKLLPAPLLERRLGLHRLGADDLLTVIFTSGSTGRPKGVMLSQHNIGSNVDAVDDMYHVTGDDTMLGVLPFFHSFGYTHTLWLPLMTDARAVYHTNPIDARTVGKLCEEHGVTIVMATPTFLASYLKRCTREQFSRLELAVVGAEKLSAELAKAFEEKFGVAPTEGYGATELSPLAAVNVPPHRAGGRLEKGSKLGTVGRAIPGVSAKVVDAETFETLGTNQEGLLWISGPNVMRGYLDQPDETAKMLQDGWYNTGDIDR
ncbi:MAG: MFS transporter, partial [Planctomycetes bacterium]|nr:MFS transporter [Planctomycetota bacterium]